MTIADNIVTNILIMELRKKHGLDTSTGSLYNKLRVNKGFSDLDAQYAVYKARGLVK